MNFTARAYAQYIATRSKDTVLLQELASRITFVATTRLGGRKKDELHYFEQWTSAEFAPIAEAFDRLLLARGWMQNE